MPMKSKRSVAIVRNQAQYAHTAICIMFASNFFGTTRCFYDFGRMLVFKTTISNFAENKSGTKIEFAKSGSIVVFTFPRCLERHLQIRNEPTEYMYTYIRNIPNVPLTYTKLIKRRTLRHTVHTPYTPERSLICELGACHTLII